MDITKDSAGKKQFSVDDVCEITGLRPYVIRFWETEFENIRSGTGADGQKSYTQGDIDLINEIKKLLRDDNLTIEKVKQHFHRKNGNEADVSVLPKVQIVTQKAPQISEVVSKPVVNRLSTDVQMVHKLNMAKEKLLEVISLTRE